MQGAAYLCTESVQQLRAAQYHMPIQRRCGRYKQHSAPTYTARINGNVAPGKNAGAKRDSYHNNPLHTFHLSHSWLVWYMVIIDITLVCSVIFSALQGKTSMPVLLSDGLKLF